VGATLVRAEYRVADFVRHFTVPDGIDVAKIDAALAGGVLRLKLPKAAALKPRKIEVKAG
jgi:HSP20 family molecular chaperone IbpA